ncbi:MAG: DUF134 domain-containing protein [Helicobacteraceae bacterium]|jgi:predicted DNA-binding protein (UPF0251 family)|nr:DUF134 domain-containing protein [Helicobacteraceae bacterium]
MRGRKRGETATLFRPIFRSFFARGGESAQTIKMSQEELEALRLADYEGLHHEIAATKLALSRPTFSRLLERARKKTAEFLIFGKSLAIEVAQKPFLCAYYSNDRVTTANSEALYLVIASIDGGKIRSMRFEDAPKAETLPEKLSDVNVVALGKNDGALKERLNALGFCVLVAEGENFEQIARRL